MNISNLSNILDIIGKYGDEDIKGTLVVSEVHIDNMDEKHIELLKSYGLRWNALEEFWEF